MSNANYTTLGLQPGASFNNVKKEYRKLAITLHPNKLTKKTEAEKTAGEARFKNVSIAFARIEAKHQNSGPPNPANNGQRTRVAGNITAFKAKVIDNFFRKNKPAKLVPGPGGNTTLAVVPAKLKTNKPTLALTNVQGEPHKVIKAPAAVHEALVTGQITNPQLGLTGGNRQIVPYVPPSRQNVEPSPPPGPASRRSFLNFFKGFGRPSAPAERREAVTTRQNAPPPRRSLLNRFGGLFGPRAPAPVNWERVAKQERNARMVNAIKKGNFIASGRFKGAKPGYKFTLGTHGQGYYRNTIEYGPKGPPSVNTKNMGTGTNNGIRNMGTGYGGRGGGGSTRVRTGNVRTGATRIGNVKSTSGSSRVEGVRGGSSQSEGGRGGSISFAPVIKINVPQAAAQTAVQALPAQERLALTNAGGYSSAAAAVANAGGPATVERAIAALNANGGNVNAAMQKTGLSRQVFNNVNKLGGPVTARRTLMAVKKVTVKTAPYVGQNATQRVAPNVYALAPVPVKKHRKKRMEVKLSELNRVINAVKKKKLTSLVAHNVTKTNIHANNARLKSYYKRVIKAAILKTPFAKIAREHAKKLVVSPRVKKPRRKTTNLSYA